MCALHDHKDLVACDFHASLPGHLRLCWSRMSWPGIFQGLGKSWRDTRNSRLTLTPGRKSESVIFSDNY